jgi:hypothetical protein
MGLVRELLFKIEGDAPDLDVEGKSAGEVIYHLVLIEEAGLIKSGVHQRSEW